MFDPCLILNSNKPVKPVIFSKKVLLIQGRILLITRLS
ncbi:hypothetical protein LEP1GSC199_3224 [Leptospira vanthielii serovar Holland str. Waz Holland = ATCC 700522]|uniref:Uncharacterized protein n=1 Tax=Leptospira vanthielii serovar Holland str. Waz Holland = ATCC 700522 TaxID=1218591 RepID=N1W6A0_9LEPT|nr:hypothetical protein LEP1GSC199_3224 [Leptospira vanthielii serovar Holland str. Waz Holland = ATCC 700522]